LGLRKGGSTQTSAASAPSGDLSGLWSGGDEEAFVVDFEGDVCGGGGGGGRRSGLTGGIEEDGFGVGDGRGGGAGGSAGGSGGGGSAGGGPCGGGATAVASGAAGFETGERDGGFLARDASVAVGVDLVEALGDAWFGLCFAAGDVSVVVAVEPVKDLGEPVAWGRGRGFIFGAGGEEQEAEGQREQEEAVEERAAGWMVVHDWDGLG